MFNPVAWCAVVLIIASAASIFQAFWGVIPAIRTWVSGSSWHGFLAAVGVPIVVGVIISITLLALYVVCGWFWMIQVRSHIPSLAA